MLIATRNEDDYLSIFEKLSFIENKNEADKLSLFFEEILKQIDNPKIKLRKSCENLFKSGLDQMGEKFNQYEEKISILDKELQ